MLTSFLEILSEQEKTDLLNIRWGLGVTHLVGLLYVRSSIQRLFNLTWNSTQCYGAAWMDGRGVCREIDTCIYMAESLC